MFTSCVQGGEVIPMSVKSKPLKWVFIAYSLAVNINRKYNRVGVMYYTFCMAFQCGNTKNGQTTTAISSHLCDYELKSLKQYVTDQQTKTDICMQGTKIKGV